MTNSGTNQPSDPGDCDESAGDIECQAARNIVHRRIDAESSADELDRLDAHLNHCDSCSRYAAEMASVMSRIAELRVASEAPVAAMQPIGADTGAIGYGRSRWLSPMMRIAAVIAIGCVGVWTWTASRHLPTVRVTDVGPNVVGTDFPVRNPDVPVGRGASPDSGKGGQSPRLAARIINPRSRDSTYIPVQRDTSRPNVKLFALYEKVR